MAASPSTVTPDPAAVLRQILPPEGFLADYCRYAEPLTDAPLDYHAAVAITLAATVLATRLHVSQFGARNPLSQWFVLLAPSGFYRKSTSINIGAKILRAHDPEVFLPDVASQERMTELLATRADRLLLVPELAAYLRLLDRDYNAGLKQFLTHLYDGPERYASSFRYQQGTASVVKDVRLSIIGASTVDWLIERLQAGDVRGGFFSRFTFVAPAAKSKWQASSPEPDSNLQRRLAAHLKGLAAIKETAAILPERVLARHAEWLRAFENESHAPDLWGFYTRLGANVLKWAVIFEATRSQGIEVTEDSYSRAALYAERCRQQLESVAEQFEFSSDGRQRVRVEEIIRQRPGVDWSTLLRLSHLSARHLTDAVDTLKQSDRIREGSLPRQEGVQGRRPRNFFPAATVSGMVRTASAKNDAKETAQ